MTTFQWRVVAEFPDYEICEDGSLRSFRRKSREWKNPRSGRRDEPLPISGTVTPFGYTAYILRKTGESKPYRRVAHRLVALAFLPNTAGLTDVAHNDGNPRNNHVSNLRWDTHRNNQMDMREHGTMQDGEKSITVKISAVDAATIRARAATEGRGSGRRLALEYGLSPAQISRIVNGKRWVSL